MSLFDSVLRYNTTNRKSNTYPDNYSSMSSNDDSREQGVEFGPLVDELESEEFPMEKDELLAEYGSRDIDLEDDKSQTLEELLGPMGETTYDSVDEIMNNVMSMVPEGAVGREDYSDRSDELNEEEREDESI